MGERIRFRLYQSWRNRGKWDMCLSFGCGGVGGVRREWVGLRLGPASLISLCLL